MLTPTAGAADRFAFESVGARYAFPVTAFGRGFNEAEGFLTFNLPWSWDFECTWLPFEWRVQTRFDVSAGWLGRDGRDAWLATAGPILVFSHEHWPVSLEGGSVPTFISHHEFGNANLGTDFQFTTHIGLNWDFAPHVRLGYRFQHMSNAGISRHNPGLNLQALSLSYVF
jgi:hypothetical protein